MAEMSDGERGEPRQAKNVLRTVDDEARRLARSLVRAARHGALATLTPGERMPLASRFLVAADDAGRPLLLVSALSAHASALQAEPRCSLLLGEIGPGDPLAHPRISLFGEAQPLLGDERSEARERFLARHPSAEVYCDFADFRFLRIELSRASLNGGFARAYEMAREDVVDRPRPDLRERLRRAMNHMNEDHADAVDAIAAVHAKAEGEGWRIVTVDASGFEIARQDLLRRIFFETPIETADDIRAAFVTLAKRSMEDEAYPTSPIA